MKSRTLVGRSSRRDFLKRSFGGAVGLAGLSLLPACAPQAPAQPSGAKPASDAKPATTQAPAAQTGERTLVVSNWSGSTETTLNEYLIPKFQREHNVTVQQDLGSQGPRFAKLQAQKGSGNIDIFFSTDELVYTGIKQDLFETVDDSRLSNLKLLQDWARPIPNHGPAFGVVGYGMAYHAEQVKDPPKKWADLWRPEFSGKLALPNSSYSLFPSFLLKTAELGGGGKDNMDAGFAKMAELKPAKAFVIFTEWVPLFTQGEVVAMPEIDIYVWPQKDQKYPIEFVLPEDGGFTAVSLVSIVKGTRNRELAHEFVNAVLDPEFQAEHARLSYYGPTVKDVKLPPELASKIAYGDRLKNMRMQDGKLASDSRASWVEKFNTQVSPKWAG
jgi:putative spermidine/putrescine transport system substrate-binding protein